MCLVGSRFLHPAKTRYALNEGETLAVTYGLHQSRYFVLGCKNFIVAADHKPLLNVLNDRSLSDIQNRRLHNLKEKTLLYSFDIVHVPGKKHLGPDTALRYPVGHPTRLMLPGEPVETDFGDVPLTYELKSTLINSLATIEEEGEDTEECLQYAASTGLIVLNSVSTVDTACRDLQAKHRRNVINWSDVRTATAADPNIQSNLQLLVTGFPDDSRTLSPQICLYHPFSWSFDDV